MRARRNTSQRRATRLTGSILDDGCVPRLEMARIAVEVREPALEPALVSRRPLKMPVKTWVTKSNVDSLFAIWTDLAGDKRSASVRAYLAHMLDHHADRLRETALRPDGKQYRRDFELVLNPSRGRHRRPSRLAYGVVERLAGQLASSDMAETGKISGQFYRRHVADMRSAPKITSQMRRAAAAVWLLGGGRAPRTQGEGHRAHTPFRLLASELLNLVDGHDIEPALAEYSRGRNGGSALVYSPLVMLACEIDRIAFDHLIKSDELRRRMLKRSMRAATLSEGRERMVKARKQMRANERAGHGYNVIGHRCNASTLQDAERWSKALGTSLKRLRASYAKRAKTGS
jgi:hypothetical protein